MYISAIIAVSLTSDYSALFNSLVCGPLPLISVVTHTVHYCPPTPLSVNRPRASHSHSTSTSYFLRILSAAQTKAARPSGWQKAPWSSSK